MPTSEFPQRYSNEARIERISRWQFREHLDKYWWLSDPKVTDIGKDEFIEIYDEGVASGITFYVQLKGTEKPITSFLVNGEFLSYPVTVNNLRDWSVSSVPIVFVLWNIIERTGYWLYIPDEVKRIEKHNKTWREQENVMIRIPKLNTFDSEGFEKLRTLLIEYYLPSMLKEKGLRGSLTFKINMNEEDGKRFDLALQNVMAHGGSLDIEEKYFSELQYSEWYERLTGIHQLKLSATNIKFGHGGENKRLPYRVEFTTESGVVQGFETEFKVDVAGLETVTISNNQHFFPLKMRIRLPRNQFNHAVEFQIMVNGLGNDVVETKQLLSFLLAFDQGGSLDLISHNNIIVSDIMVTVPPNQIRLHTSQEYLDFLDGLCLIQRRSRKKLSVTGKRLLEEDVRNIQRIIQLYKGQAVDLSETTFGVEFQRERIAELAEAMQQMGTLQLQFRLQKFMQSVLGQEINVGTVEGEIVAVSVDSPRTLQSLYQIMIEGERRKLPLHVISGTMRKVT
jgi:hypothetical protein